MVDFFETADSIPLLPYYRQARKEAKYSSKKSEIQLILVLV